MTVTVKVRCATELSRLLMEYKTFGTAKIVRRQDQKSNHFVDSIFYRRACFLLHTLRLTTFHFMALFSHYTKTDYFKVFFLDLSDE